MVSQTTDCIFCRIAQGELGTELVAESEHAVAFRDIEPQAPTHVLVVPKQHLAALHEAGESEATLLGEMLLLANEVAAKEGLTERGYRVLINDGAEACQSVHHLHLHVLGGRQLACQMG